MFRVDWLQSALTDLADAWVEADSAVRQAITTAAHQLEHDLRANPENVGESREEGHRIHFVYPLAATYQVDAAQSVVTILTIRPYRRRG